jgi:GxxExxY protein
MEFKALTEKIIGCAFKVYNTLGYGFLESVYENSLLIELRKTRLNAENQRPVKVYYEGETVGDFIADIYVEDCIIVELKSVQRLIEAMKFNW